MLYYEVALSGRKSESKPVRFLSSGAVRNVVMFGDRLFYDSNWPAGHPISSQAHLGCELHICEDGCIIMRTGR